ncbi:hypothetical protein Syun_011272 [Stephania yunnanensis]|uniref:Uncharacterized protein n=1 Tax=Stephania yunnanensis TaxID=152371 RepID=A0AAP0JZL9_9MAGN
MAIPQSLILLALLLFFTLSTANPNPNPKLSSAHEELQHKGFPIGLLPLNVLGYTLNRTSGAFAVNLDGSCKLTLPPDNYLATYSERVTGKLVEGKIAELDGIRVRALFQWWSITGIRSSGDNLVFEVGVLSAKYPARNFNESQECENRPRRSSS